uniref:Uncharacterized protein n=1 Tax=Anopheles culicifacies TaxID=139723 RepID=A0A182MSK7_9DIPT
MLADQNVKRIISIAFVASKNGNVSAEPSIPLSSLKVSLHHPVLSGIKTPGRKTSTDHPDVAKRHPKHESAVTSHIAPCASGHIGLAWGFVLVPSIVIVIAIFSGITHPAGCAQ